MLRKLWRIIRRLTGDDAYERYLVHHREAHGSETPLGRKEYFKREQEQKWNGIRRCC